MTQTLQTMPTSTLQCTRSILWLALVYDLFQLFEPQSITQSILTRITSTSLMKSSCPCSASAFDNETFALAHMRSQHFSIHGMLVVIRRRKADNIDEFVQSLEGDSTVKQRLIDVARIRRRLPPDPVLAKLRKESKIKMKQKQASLNDQLKL